MLTEVISASVPDLFAPPKSFKDAHRIINIALVLSLSGKEELKRYSHSETQSDGTSSDGPQLSPVYFLLAQRLALAVVPCPFLSG